MRSALAKLFLNCIGMGRQQNGNEIAGKMEKEEHMKAARRKNGSWAANLKKASLRNFQFWQMLNVIP